VLAGVPESEEIRHIAFLLDDERISGKGWAIRAASELARIVKGKVLKPAQLRTHGRILL